MEVNALRPKLEKVEGDNQALARVLLSYFDNNCDASEAISRPFLIRSNNGEFLLTAAIRFRIAIIIARRVCSGWTASELRNSRNLAMWKTGKADGEMVEDFKRNGFLDWA